MFNVAQSVDRSRPFRSVTKLSLCVSSYPIRGSSNTKVGTKIVPRLMGSSLQRGESGRCTLRALTPAFVFQYQPLEALLVAIVLFPAGEVAYVALVPQQTRPGFRSLSGGSNIAADKDSVDD